MSQTTLRLHEQLGRRLKRRRELSGLTIPRAAKLSGVAKGYLYGLEMGMYDNPGLKVLEKLARFYRCSVGELLERDP